MNGVRVVAMLAVVAGAAACSGAPSIPSSADLTGLWGGDHVTMTVAGTGAHFEFDCAHGDLVGPVKTDARGGFDVTGTWVREHGGPIRSGDSTDSRPARYTGAVRTDDMGLTIQLTDTGENLGTFSLTRDSPGRVVKCL